MKNNNNFRKALKAYYNNKFLGSPAARTIRLLSEYQEPLDRLRKNQIDDTIVIFGSARIKSPREAKRDLTILKRELKLAVHEPKKKRIQEKISDAEINLKNSKYYADTEELSYMLTKWSKSLNNGNKFVVSSGGGPGIMEAANKGARKADGFSIGFNISLPFEQYPNRYITPDLNFEFHYFFMRKFWFVYLAKAVVVMPGGFGTLDELMEVLTLVQTNKLRKKMAIVIYGKEFWDGIINFEALAENNVISKSDIKLFRFENTPEGAFEYLKKSLKNYIK
ncbi:MAG: TIGR00730 family Rossman fold protein [Ignavibacteria bacterium]|nr:TIGR00730 family Rossman fold protein [Ignavibacteria bacterium]